MQNLLNDLTELLKRDERFVSEGKLLKNKVVEAALKPDEKLLKLLLKDKIAKKYFFKDIGGIFVFDKIQFQKFVSNKSFLPDSYTAFSNKIGLTSNDEFISESKNVVLSWPYKDCVLEGGQTKEEEKRKEIFWNETLAPDEIDRLLSPKAFTNFKKFDKDGEHKLKDITLEDNLIIKGNNLLALHSLLPVYRGKVKLIYIDPPYNTGNDSFGYNDSFNHSTWLTFMKNRLEVARDLLHEKGAIFIQCDDNEQAYLKVLMDAIFKDTFITSICVQMSYVSGEKMAHIDKKPPKIKEFLLFYSKFKGLNIKPQYSTNEIDKEYNKFIIKKDSKPENWEVVSIDSIFKKNKVLDIDKENFMIENADLIFNRVRNKSDIYKKTLGNKRLTQIITKTGLKKWAWNGREAIFLSDRLIKDHEGNITYRQALGDIWTDIPIVNLYLEGNVKLLGGKKPEALISRVIDMASDKNDLILDFHLGSGTTAAVAHKLERKYIGIEQLSYSENDSVTRLKDVINGDSTGISNDVNWKGGGSFVYLELSKLNQNFTDQIVKAKTTKELKSIWGNMKESGFISYKINPKDIDQNISEFEKLSIEDQKKFLIKVLDKNHLYVNYSEIEDKDYKISEEDKKLNKIFYNLK